MLIITLFLQLWFSITFLRITKDKDELVINPITGKLDTVRTFNPDRIVVAQRNSAGRILKTVEVYNSKEVIKILEFWYQECEKSATCSYQPI
jgi:hypothetical protein